MGHGPSTDRVSDEWVDKHWVVRLRRAIPFVGTRTDAICSYQARYEQRGIEFWHLDGELYRLCAARLKEFNPKFAKPTTGLSAVIIARDRNPDKDIGVIGFDYTLHPETAKHWRHDAYAECECIKTLNVIEI